MTSEAPRFPIVLTLLVAGALAILVWLGVWQLQRSQWKQQELARIDRLERAPPVPIADALARASAGADVELTRVQASCAPAAPAPARLRMSAVDGDWVAHAISVCALADGPYAGVLADRGIIVADRGQTNPTAPVLPAPGDLVGVLFRPDPVTGAPPAKFAPYVLSVENETPPAPGIRPAPYAASAANLQYAGAYAPTWFGLAGVLALVYAALLWRRLHPKA